ncbi:unnamed protein product [Macrosiphum euphorbiae]|uniref:Uncharacterized protein n=1 Tax=Macrosiphum euphorbiae TaxID=13131 RepID=A0AAV0XUJ0_9HEMI|nr:unnamed protein product [Macrosiphum euphorbiae]
MVPFSKLVLCFSKELCDFPHFVPAGAPSAPKSVIAPKFSAELVLFDGTVFKISAMYPFELCDFPYFDPAGAPLAPKSAIAPKLSAQLVLISGTVSKISAVVSQKLQRGLPFSANFT